MYIMSINTHEVIIKMAVFMDNYSKVLFLLT